MNRVTGVLALLAVLVGGVAPCGAMVAQGVPANGPDSDGDGMPDAQDPYPLIAD